MESMISLLDSFNRKERFFLVGAALGNPQFQLSKPFRQNLAAELGLRTGIPQNASCWMDYHLDWVYASLLLHKDPAKTGPFKAAKLPSSKKGKTNVGENQEDTDLLIAFERSRRTHLIFVEAKGAMLFGNEQIHSKARRLAYIFGQDGKKHGNSCRPYFVLSSPAKPRIRQGPRSTRGIDTKPLPNWMKKSYGSDLFWVELQVPPPGSRRRITRESNAPQSPWGIRRNYR